MTMSSKMLRASVAALFVVVVLPGCAVFPRSSYPSGDQRITADVETRFERHADLQAPNLLEIQAINRVVYLHGTVSSDLQRTDAESVANEVQGVEKVVNSIAVAN
jgi:osmotically-inducible protein OsmY